MEGNPKLMADPTLKRWRDMIKAGGKEAYAAAWEIIQAKLTNKFQAAWKDPTLISAAWEHHIKVCEKYQRTGPVHRVPRVRVDVDAGWGQHPPVRRIPRRPGSGKADHAVLGPGQREPGGGCWKTLAAYEQKTGGQVLAIPHNSNLSGGRMFALMDFEGNPFTTDYARTRARWEPLIEIVQTKGQSETCPYLSPADEFADFAVWDKMNLGALQLDKDSFFKGEYAREALKNGLLLEQQLGTESLQVRLRGRHGPAHRSDGD